ncbi:MAG: hypothetical protein ACR2F8_03065 [Caulobacteraceae bacterium]
MAALTADRNTPRRTGEMFDRFVKGGAKIYAGALVCLDAGGFAVPGAVATTLKAVGRAELGADNTGGADGAITANVRPGCYRWDNSAGGDLVAQADIGADAYVVDDHTVAKTNGGSTRSVAGQILFVDSLGVYVATGAVPYPV